MSEEFAVEVSDELAAKLHQDESVSDTLVAALRCVYGTGEEDPAAEKQAELQERMGLNPSSDTDDSDDSATEAELVDLQREQLKAFLRQERKDGIEK
jgi:hypothetical protein